MSSFSPQQFLAGNDLIPDDHLLYENWLKSKTGSYQVCTREKSQRVLGADPAAFLTFSRENQLCIFVSLILKLAIGSLRYFIGPGFRIPLNSESIDPQACHVGRPKILLGFEGLSKHSGRLQ
jgi:hypothetical protein